MRNYCVYMHKNKVNGKVYPVDFLGGYEVYYQPEKSNDDFDIEMGG